MEPRRTTFTPRFAITLLFVAVVSYFWGGFTVYKQIFPYRQIQNLKNKYVGDSLTSSPRYTMFQTFSPTSDVVMVGDSLTADAPWNEIFPKVQIANRGMGGDTTDNILLRMDTVLSVTQERMSSIFFWMRRRDEMIAKGAINTARSIPASRPIKGSSRTSTPLDAQYDAAQAYLMAASRRTTEAPPRPWSRRGRISERACARDFTTTVPALCRYRDPQAPTIAGRLSDHSELRYQPFGNSAGDLCRRLVGHREHRTDVDLA